MSLSARESRAFRNCFVGAFALFTIAVAGETALGHEGAAACSIEAQLDARREQAVEAVFEHLHGNALVRGTGKIVSTLVGHLLGRRCE